MRKGQAALEFLMTYGWAILVVLAAIAALAYFGVLSPDRFLPNKCTLQGGFSCTEFKVNSAGESVQFTVQNNLGVDADDVEVSLTSDDCTVTTGVQWNQPLGNGDETDLMTFNCQANTLGSKFRGDINVTYVRAGETVSHTTIGSLTSQAE